MATADDAEAAWSTMLDQIDGTVERADPVEMEIVLTAIGVVSQRL